MVWSTQAWDFPIFSGLLNRRKKITILYSILYAYWMEDWQVYNLICKIENSRQSEQQIPNTDDFEQAN